MNDIIIIGGGIMGMLTARALDRFDITCTIVERRECGREASWAGGGIVSPLYPWRHNDAITALSAQSQEIYPELCQELFDITGIDPQWRQSGSLMLSPKDYAEAISWAKTYNLNLMQLNYQDCKSIEPHCRLQTDDFGIWMPEVAQICNPLLCQALYEYLLKCTSTEILCHQNVENFIINNNQIAGVVTDKETRYADAVIIAAGAWSGTLLQNLQINLTIKPVRGQMLRLRLPQHGVTRIVQRDGRYIIPRADGSLLVGSTLEDCGFDQSTTEQGFQDLMTAANSIIPNGHKAKLLQHWAGLRPGTDRGKPYICQLPQYDNLYLNAGHYRNGLVLAPASAQLLADIIGKKDVTNNNFTYLVE